MGWLPGRSWDFTKAKLYTDFSGVQKNGWRLWPLASWVTYQYIPLRLRVLFVNVVAFFWYVDSDLLKMPAIMPFGKLTADRRHATHRDCPAVTMECQSV